MLKYLIVLALYLALFSHGQETDEDKILRIVKDVESRNKLLSNSNINILSYAELLSLGVNKNTILSVLSRLRPPSCKPKAIKCDAGSKYRSVTGECNNLGDPQAGSMRSQFTRLLHPEYTDGYSQAKGQGLPNARHLSSLVHGPWTRKDEFVTNLLPHFGQFLDHDISLIDREIYRCCADPSVHPDCLPVQIYTNDTFYSTIKNGAPTCLEFTRSTPYCFPGLSGVREQLNLVSSYIDGNMIYGSTEEITFGLREFVGGRLRSEKGESRFMPTVEEISRRLGRDLSSEVPGVYMAGDFRVNQNPPLTVMHNLFFLEHNRIAKEIGRVKPGLSEEDHFQLARKILISELQNIVYSEFLPILIGPEYMEAYDLKLPTSAGSFSNYNPNIKASIDNEFATAAFRFGHTLINGAIQTYVSNSFGKWDLVNGFILSDNFFNNSQIIRLNGQGYNLILGGLMVQKSEVFDPHVTKELNQLLFKEPGKDFGEDLITLNIQRGRDHGLASWVKYRKFCGQSVPTSFDPVFPGMRPSGWGRLKEIYSSVDKIELFSGGTSEFFMPGTVLGPMFNCIQANNFRRIKNGDRFFFTHGGQSGSLTPSQLINIRRRTFGDIICENSNISFTPKSVFYSDSNTNPNVACNSATRNKIDAKLFV